MARPGFTSVFEENESVIRNRMLEQIPDAWRKEPGDFIYDAIAAAPLEIKQGQIQRDYILKNSFAQYAEGEYLDYKLYEVGLTRLPATANKRTLAVTADAGVVVPSGHTTLSVIADGDGNPYEFTVDTLVRFTEPGSQTVAITCKSPGASGNLPTGTQFIFQPSIPGVRIIADGGTTVPGSDEESDDDAWARYDFKVKNTDTGGNKNDYVRWAREITGVYKARCIPRWNGNGTVKVVLVGNDYKPATVQVVNDVQEYLDPGLHGLGEGKAPCGALVTVVAATDVSISISASIVWAPDADQVAAKLAFEGAVNTYLQSLIFAAAPNVAYNKIAAFLSFTNGVANYTNLKVNDGSVDVVIDAVSMATLGTVTFS